MGPELILENGNRKIEIYNKNLHFTIEHFENGLWRQVKTANSLEEAKLIAERYVGTPQQTLLNG